MSGYVPNNRNERPAPPQEPYNGDFDRQAPRPLEGGAAQTSRCLIGLRFVWDNGECLGANIPYSLSTAGGNVIRGGLDARGSLTQTIQSNEYDAQLLADTDVDNDITSARSELQTVLDEILAAERAEAAKLQAVQDQRNVVSNYIHVRLAAGKGFFLGAWGLLKTVKEYSDLVNPFTVFTNALRSAWQAKSSTGESWLAAYNRQFSAEQHRELVEALGFDPTSITREQLAEAYELANFIYEDGPSKAMLGRFAVDYAKAQNVEEVAEFGGAALFEIVLAALLIVFTGGLGLAARGASSVSYVSKLTRLGNALKRLSAALKRARIKLSGHVRGTGQGAQIVEVKRPPAIPVEVPAVPILRSWSHLKLSERHFPHKVTIPKNTGNTMYTVAPEEVAKDLKEIHTRGEEIRNGEFFNTSSGRVFGLHENSIHPVSGPGTVNITSAEYNILVTAKKKGLSNARQSLDIMSQKGIFTPEQKQRTSQLLDLMQDRGIK
ncbi:hypothetical protein [Pseudomonas sp. GD03944]|uniref:hypothetical protein n=1 Tax=Pseudomonas sp. GD03944 TaxID=2975409 RepID=UPI0024491C62|nr:hypothetical protein [Pseudomonas sp. GD03944]MDH1263069.1 hypothetical protein [Pseudomonas sp. GD03944]